MRIQKYTPRELRHIESVKDKIDKLNETRKVKTLCFIVTASRAVKAFRTIAAGQKQLAGGFYVLHYTAAGIASFSGAEN